MTQFSAGKAFAEKKHKPRIYSFSLVLLQCLLLALYRIVLPVLILIHCGIGLFCFPFLARILLTLNVFKADMIQLCKIFIRYLLYIYSSNTVPDTTAVSLRDTTRKYTK